MTPRPFRSIGSTVATAAARSPGILARTMAALSPQDPPSNQIVVCFPSAADVGPLPPALRASQSSFSHAAWSLNARPSCAISMAMTPGFSSTPMLLCEPSPTPTGRRPVRRAHTGSRADCVRADQPGLSSCEAHGSVPPSPLTLNSNTMHSDNSF